MMNNPILFSFLLFLLLSLSAMVGSVLQRSRPLKEEDRDDFGVIQAATLTLLGLIIGFSFSMAITRYDQRKNYEEEEANAIGTEYVRADLLPAADAAKARDELKRYLDLRIQFYVTRRGEELNKVNAETATLQNQLWNSVKGPSMAQPTPPMALVLSGMNDVLNSQGYTQAAWWNRIPVSAWALMVAIAVCANILVGYGAKGRKVTLSLIVVMPLVVAISFLLIADIDSPRGGFIHVAPQNLTSLANSLQ